MAALGLKFSLKACVQGGHRLRILRWSKLRGGQMQVGDLVELSAYGKKIQPNSPLHGKRGLVVETRPNGYWYKVHWFRDYTCRIVMSRRDLKHVKAKKST